MRTLFLLGLLGLGCGGGVHSDVDPNKPAATVTMDEARRVCEGLSSYYLAVFPVSRQQQLECTRRALLNVTAGPEACSASVQTCLTNPPAPLDFLCTVQTAPAGCNATVGEVEACMTADTNALDVRASMVSCAVAGNVPELTRLAAAIPVPAECMRIAETCPAYGDGFYPR